MIILYYETYKNKQCPSAKTNIVTKEIVNMFDTAKEFKEYIQNTLIDMEKGLNADGELDNGLLFNPRTVQETSFHDQLEQYLEMTDELVEVK